MFLKKKFWGFHRWKQRKPYNEYSLWPAGGKKCIFPSLSRLKEICSQVLGDYFLGLDVDRDIDTLEVKIRPGAGRQKIAALAQTIGKETKER